MEQTPEHAAVTRPPSIHPAAYVLAGISFIPLLGLPFGLAAIVWGLAARKKRGGKIAALIAAAGVACSVAVYGALFYFGFQQRGGVYDKLRVELAQQQLGQLVQSIEFHKLQHGQYPESLAALQQAQPKTPLFVIDPTDTRLTDTPRLFHYERVGAEHYYLRSAGMDGVPFTADDIVPNTDTAGGKIGLLKEKAQP